MQIRLLLSFCLFFICSGVLASVVVDSVGVENLDGKKVILHKVEAHETYYSIARKYGVSARSISDFYHTSILKIGDIVKVQTDILFEQKIVSVTSAKNQKKSSLTTYVVNPKETLYAVAKKFGMTVDEVKELNELKSDGLAVGKVLKVRSVSNPNVNKNVETIRVQVSDRVPANAQVTTNDQQSDDTVNSANNHLKHPSTRYGLYETTERGVALCISDENLDGSKMLALHRSAPIGTVIKITNPMTQKSTFVKVVGKFTESEFTKNVTIVLTKAVADLVGALDKKFQVNLMYGVPNE